MDTVGLDFRLKEVERVLRQLVKDFYETPDLNPALETPAEVTKAYILSLEQENEGLKAHVNHLRELRDKMTPLIELKDARIAELEESRARVRNELDEYVDENDRLAEECANLLEERDEAQAQLRDVRAVLL